MKKRKDPKLSEITIVVPLYDYPIKIIVGTAKQLDRHIRKVNRKLIDSHNPVGYFTGNESQSGKVIGWEHELTVAFRRWPYRRTVVHESTHLAKAIFRSLGIPRGDKTEEPEAYLTDAIYGLIDEAFDKESRRLDKLRKKKRKKKKRK